MNQADFVVYSLGILCASVCTSLSDEETTHRLNVEEPTGVDSRWEISADPTFKGGKPNPCPCDREPETHRHILFNC